ncbi:MAG: type III pantothenate kinase [Limisphaerales bacterium]
MSTPKSADRGHLLLLDIGNTHCHAGLATPRRLVDRIDIPTAEILAGRPTPKLARLAAGRRPSGCALCSVVPAATPRAVAMVESEFGISPLVLTHKTLRSVGIDYPKPATIGPDRLANALAARHLHRPPVVVVDFGTAVTFDIVDAQGRYSGGIIAPGLAVMTDYLHEKTALLPRIRIREIRSAIGRSTEEAMLVGAVHGYRGLVRQLIHLLRKELRVDQLPVVATGGYARLIARGIPEITSVRPNLTLEGLRLLWREHHPSQR